ncbi:MAG: hypothetical protein ABL995_16500 [Bryobacteraceae bacterium]
MRKLCLLAFLSASFLQAQAAKPVVLMGNLGNATHPIATANTEAQKFFDQGLTLLWGFNRFEALRSFRRASELDPKSVMPVWGIAMALSPHINMDLDGDVNLKEACAALEKVSPMLAGAPIQDGAYIETVFARCKDEGAYIAAARALASRYPDDLDAATLYAESLMIPVRWKWWESGRPAAGVEEAIRTLEAVLRRDPNHIGANHFYIHAVEASPDPERGIPSAQRLMGLVPGAGHLVHMPGHIWLRTGNYALAARVNDRAADVDRDYFAKTGVTTSAYAGYYIHNLHFIVYGRQMEGRFADALAAARSISTDIAPMVAQMPAMVDPFVPMPLFVLVRFNKWNEVLAEPTPGEKTIAARAVSHWARALAYRAKADSAAAAKEAAEFEDIRKTVPRNAQWANNTAADVLAIASEVLAARLAADPSAAVPHWQKAVQLQDALIYDEPPPWYYPIRESLGAELYRDGRFAEAEQVFREGLEQTPRDGRILFGLMETLKMQNKTSAADSVRRELETAWKTADSTLSIAGL